MWGPSRHLGNLTAANWVSFDFNVAYSSCWGYSLRWGWVFLERTRILSGIQFTTHFIEFIVVETKRFVCSTVNVIMRPALEQGCGKQTPSAGKLFSRANLLYVPNIKMYRRLRSGSVHNFGTCVWRTATQWRLPEKKRVSTQEKSEFVVALWFSKRKSRNCVQT